MCRPILNGHRISFLGDLGNLITEQKATFMLPMWADTMVLVAFNRPSLITVDDVISDLLAR